MNYVEKNPPYDLTENCTVVVKRKDKNPNFLAGVNILFQNATSSTKGFNIGNINESTTTVKKISTELTNITKARINFVYVRKSRSKYFFFFIITTKDYNVITFL